MEARVSDFGLATLMEANQSHVSTVVAGTFGYLAPGAVHDHKNFLVHSLLRYYNLIVIIDRVLRYGQSNDKRGCL